MTDTCTYCGAVIRYDWSDYHRRWLRLPCECLAALPAPELPPQPTRAEIVVTGLLVRLTRRPRNWRTEYCDD